MQSQIVDHVVDGPVHGAACGLHMAAASEISAYGAHIHRSVGTKADLVLVVARLIEENGYLYSFGHPKLTDNTIQICMGGSIEIQIPLPDPAYNDPAV